MRVRAVLALVLSVSGCPSPPASDAGIDARGGDAPIADPDAPERDAPSVDAPSVDAPMDAPSDPLDALDAPEEDGGIDAACVPTGICGAGEGDCVSPTTVMRCSEVRPCELDWAYSLCPAGETCGTRLDGRRDCGRPEELTCENDYVPSFDFRCRTEGDSYCTPDHRGMWVCGQSDADTCLEATLTPCAADEACPASAFGACACVSECTVGALRCGEDLVSEERCEDTDADGCGEWHPVRGCPTGQTCLASTGLCSSTCADDCTTFGRGCYRSPVSVGECGFLDADPCRDFRRTECPHERSLCDIGTTACVECFGGIDCGPAVEVCRAGTCTPPPGTCYEGSGSLAVVPAGTAAGAVTVFIGLRLPDTFPPFGDARLRHPSGTVVSIDLSRLRDGYVDTVFDTVDATDVPELGTLGAPGGAWSLTLVSGGPPITLERWAVCIAP